MTAELISGTEISKAILEEITKEVAEMKAATGKYNDMIDTKIAEIKSECEIK